MDVVNQNEGNERNIFSQQSSVRTSTRNNQDAIRIIQGPGDNETLAFKTARPGALKKDKKPSNMFGFSTQEDEQ